MRISDWSSDVCSSDLGPEHGRQRHGSGGHQTVSPVGVLVTEDRSYSGSGGSSKSAGLREALRHHAARLGALAREMRQIAPPVGPVRPLQPFRDREPRPVGDRPPQELLQGHAAAAPPPPPPPNRKTN